MWLQRKNSSPARPRPSRNATRSSPRMRIRLGRSVRSAPRAHRLPVPPHHLAAGRARPHPGELGIYLRYRETVGASHDDPPCLSTRSCGVSGNPDQSPRPGAAAVGAGFKPARARLGAESWDTTAIPRMRRHVGSGYINTHLGSKA